MSQASMDTLGALLQIEQDVRQAQTHAAVEFIAANDTWRVLPYRQAVLWRQHGDARPVVSQVSGLADVAGDSPYKQWLCHVIGSLENSLEAGKARLLTIDDMPSELRDGWQEWASAVVAVVLLPTPMQTSVGGLWLALEVSPTSAEIALLERLSWAYGQALWAWRPEQSWANRCLSVLRAQKRKKRIWFILALVCLFPMRLTVLARAETVGREAKLITAPVDGVVAKFFVTPNQTVKAGDVLFALDDTTFRNRFEVSEKSRAVAQADYLRATQKAFGSEESKSEINVMRAKFEEKQAEEQFTKDLLQRIRVIAPDAGVIIYTDSNEWLGRPVQTGERIAQLADPQKVEVLIHLPVDDALALDEGAPMKLYLNISPVSAQSGALTQISYEPLPMPEGYSAYILKANLDPGESIPRIGLKGTAKIYGAWAPLVYHVLRKPVSALRRLVGI